MRKLEVVRYRGMHARHIIPVRICLWLQTDLTYQFGLEPFEQPLVSASRRQISLQVKSLAGIW